ncbi:uncharacterized protein LOC143904899 [Temnothorax americanus]|uniref:uncharacterized protein LOC143904899 n=1 Tax=Temnothorax americanus TaxID=1964332 RepID=UPI004068047F
MKSMDVPMEDNDCVVETVMPVKKKKMRQAQLPFQMLSSSESPSSTDNAPNKKKRKVMSPLVESKSPKVVKLATKENLVRNVHEKEGEERKLNRSNDSVEVITSDDEKKDLEQSDQQETKKGDSTPKRSLGKKKKLDRSQQNLGALTKFLKKTDKQVEESDVSHDNNLSEFKDDKDCQDTSVHKEKNEICLNEGSGTSVIRSELQDDEEDCQDTSVHKEKNEICLNEGSGTSVIRSELQDDEEDCQDTSVHKEKNEICLNESSGRSVIRSELQDSSQLSETDDRVANKDADSSLRETDCTITILSSDNEASSELDKSILSTSKEITDKPATPVTPKTDKDMKNKKLTPKQLEKRKEIVRRKEEKQRLKMEKEKKREEEKANRRREREEKKKEKELKELKKQMEIEQKQKEKEAKEEERKKREEAKEEEKRKKEEERLEAERKKQKAASNFASFFVPKKQEVKSTDEENVVKVKNFMPFEVKTDMKIAPICRRKLNEDEKLLLDNKCNVDLDKTELYLEDIKRRRIVPRTSSKTWPLEAKEDDDIILLDEDNVGSSNIITDTHNLEKHRPKLLQFNENRRPPYWGTWRKRSNVLNSRRPFARDKKWFDYEIDSDDEWEEEEPGESLKGSDDEKDEENPEDDEYDVDNEFMVPHGYLSDEEARADEEEIEDMSPQTQKLKLKLLGEQFEAERNAKTYKLKPKIIGCIWQGPENSFPESVPPKVKEFLSARQAWVNNIPIIFPSASPEEDISTNAECKTPTHQSVRGAKKTKFPDEALPDLIRLVHGNRHGRHGLMREFMTFWSKKGGSHLSKVSVLSKINEIADRIACPEEGPMHLKSCWYVPENIRKQYLPDVELSLPNRWKYILTPNRKDDTEIANKTEKEERDKEKEKKHVPLITHFTKKITQEEMKKQLAKSDQEETKKPSTSKLDQEETQKQSTAKPEQEETKKQLASKSDQISVPPKLPPLQRPPKRATLISVGRGEQFPERSRQNMLAKFVGLDKEKEEPLNSEKMIDSDKV